MRWDVRGHPLSIESLASQGKGFGKVQISSIEKADAHFVRPAFQVAPQGALGRQVDREEAARKAAAEAPRAGTDFFNKTCRSISTWGGVNPSSSLGEILGLIKRIFGANPWE